MYGSVCLFHGFPVFLFVFSYFCPFFLGWGQHGVVVYQGLAWVRAAVVRPVERAAETPALCAPSRRLVSSHSFRCKQSHSHIAVAPQGREGSLKKKKISVVLIFYVHVRYSLQSPWEASSTLNLACFFSQAFFQELFFQTPWPINLNDIWCLKFKHLICYRERNVLIIDEYKAICSFFSWCDFKEITIMQKISLLPAFQGFLCFMLQEAFAVSTQPTREKALDAKI